MNYYNENDPSAAAWIMELIRAGVVPDGQLDTRSICDVQPEDLNGFDQCHFFGGILGWPEALRIAGYAGVRGLWTGSCPCQPFSAAGKRKGTADARHLWPEMFRLVKACRPQYVLGEQVEAAIRLGWLDGVFGDLEGEGYACGAAVLGAHSVGAPHIRQRLYWGAARVADNNNPRYETLQPERADGVHEQRQLCGARVGLERGGADDGLADAERAGVRMSGCGTNEGAASTVIPCADGKTRRISPEPGVFPLAHGIPGRVGLLRGYGNAIVPQVAALFITSFMESLEC